MFWLPEHRTLVPGDRILGAPDGGLTLCPESWLYWVRVNRDELRTLLEPLLDLPIERVLVSHGDRCSAVAQKHCAGACRPEARVLGMPLVSIIPAAERDPTVIALRDNHIMHVVRVLDVARCRPRRGQDR